MKTSCSSQPPEKKKEKRREIWEPRYNSFLLPKRFSAIIIFACHVFETDLDQLTCFFQVVGTFDVVFVVCGLEHYLLAREKIELENDETKLVPWR